MTTRMAYGTTECYIEFTNGGVVTARFDYVHATGLFELAARPDELHVEKTEFEAWLTDEAQWRDEVKRRFVGAYAPLLWPRDEKLNGAVDDVKLVGTIGAVEFGDRWKDQWGTELRLDPRGALSLSIPDYEWFIACHVRFVGLVQRAIA